MERNFQMERESTSGRDSGITWRKASKINVILRGWSFNSLDCGKLVPVILG